MRNRLVMYFIVFIGMSSICCAMDDHMFQARRSSLDITTSCLIGELQATYKMELFVANNCKVDVNLAHYHIGIVSNTQNGQSIKPKPLSQVCSTFSQVCPIPVDLAPAIINFEFMNNDSRNGILVGKFANLPAQNSTNLILKPGETFVFSGEDDIAAKYVVSGSVPIMVNNSLEVEGSNSYPYGRDALTDIPVGKNGLKTLVVTNYSINPINQISFQTKFPADIVYDSKLTTCSLYGNQVLNPNQSCNLVFRFTPRIEGISSSLPITVTGIDSNSQSTIVALSLNLSYNSRQTGNPQAGMVANAGTKNGITLTTPGQLPYERDSLEGIPAGAFGLKSYTVTNTSTVMLYALTFWPNELPNGVSYDATRSTCLFNNKQTLAYGQSCLLVLKYLPTERGVSGDIPIQVVGADPYTPIKYTTYTNEVINVPYSSR